MERLERLARTLVACSRWFDGLPPDTLWCLAVLVAAWWLRDRDLGRRIGYRKPDFPPSRCLRGSTNFRAADVAASGMLELGQTPDLTRQRLVELSTKGASLTALAQWPGWEQAKAVVLEVYPLPEATDELVAALLRRRYTSAEAAESLLARASGDDRGSQDRDCRDGATYGPVDCLLA